MDRRNSSSQSFRRCLDCAGIEAHRCWTGRLWHSIAKQAVRCRPNIASCGCRRRPAMARACIDRGRRGTLRLLPWPPVAWPRLAGLPFLKLEHPGYVGCRGAGHRGHGAVAPVPRPMGEVPKLRRAGRGESAYRSGRSGVRWGVHENAIEEIRGSDDCRCRNQL